MKVVLLNGSPHKNGCTFTALSEVTKALHNNDIETELVQMGSKPQRGCIACGKCYDGSSRCVFDDDLANTLIQKIQEADGFIVGSPVYYASANGMLTALLDRVFYAGNGFTGKPGAALVSARRAGTTAALDQLNKYFLISGMPLVPSQYWNMVHGHRPEDVKKDLEGLQIMETLGENMAWLLKCIDAGKKAGVACPPKKEIARTNFIQS